jgi:hypothetical protein
VASTVPSTAHEVQSKAGILAAIHEQAGRVRRALLTSAPLRAARHASLAGGTRLNECMPTKESNGIIDIVLRSAGFQNLVDHRNSKLFPHRHRCLKEEEEQEDLTGAICTLVRGYLAYFIVHKIACYILNVREYHILHMQY